jgi:transcriptional regulator with XRE-family HTH domain
MKVGEKIKELRIEKALSQSDLAKQINVSQKAIDFWERSINEPKISYIMALIEFFGISYDEFFADIDKQNNNS